MVRTIDVSSSTATVTVPLTWPKVRNWNVTLELQPGPNTISVQGLDRNGVPLSGRTDSIVITYQ